MNIMGINSDMRKSYILLAVFMDLFVSRANAQTGYIITANNDTIKGEIKIPAFSGPKFKPAGATAFKSISLDTVKEYRLTKDSSIWMAKILPSTSMNLISKPQFVHRLEHGKIDLFEQIGADREHLTTWYINGNTDTLIAIKTDDLAIIGGGSKKSRKEILLKMMADQPAIVAAFNADNKFSYDKIRAYIKQYNRAVAVPSK
jgi:hypothetical protein